MNQTGVLTGERWAGDVLMPYRPYATDKLSDGQRRRTRERALTMRYIEHSPHALLGSIVIDCDHEDAAIRAFEQPSDHPKPSWVAQSPSGRAHIGWWLAAPVCRTDSGRLQPLRFAQRVEAGLRTSVGGDLAYGGQLTKNPIHEDWETIYGTDRRYELRDLVTVHTPRQMPRRPDRVAGLARNVTMFDAARKWAYPQWWHHREGLQADWETAVLQRCHALNTEFSAPLPFTEVQATSRSVARWVWRNFDETTFRERQAARGALGGRVVTEAKREANRERGRIVTEAVREANRKRATKIDRAKALEILL